MATIAVWTEGNKVVVHAEWRVPDDTGVLTDPTTVVFTARQDNGTPRAYVFGVDTEVTRISAGIFELAIVPAAAVWRVHIQGTGVAYAAAEVNFKILSSGALG